MKRPEIRLLFYETYYFASCVRNILWDQFAFLRRLNDFYGDGSHIGLTIPFRRHSAFHHFLEFVIRDVLNDATENCQLDVRQDRTEKFSNFQSALGDLRPDVLPIEEALQHYSIPHTSFKEWLAECGMSFAEADDDDVYEYLEQLREEASFQQLLDQCVRETFFLMFGNRNVLLLFNEMLARLVHDTEIADLDLEDAARFEKDGILRRVHIPEWVKRSVFFRDRGLCCFCRKDVSGIVSIWSEDNFDHVVPLAEGGLNDVTNFQLLCAECNLRKRNGTAITSDEYEDWYSLEPLGD